MRIGLPAAMIAFLSAGACGQAADPARFREGLVRDEFIYDRASFPECHASTLAETHGGALVAAWFGGSREGAPDIGIWLARCVEGRWTEPVQVADGAASPDRRLPCWNPVLFQPRRGPLLLFLKVGPNPAAWWGEMMVSDDGGLTWKDRRRLPDGGIGPVKNKPVELPGGDLVCGSSTEDAGWRVHFERTADLGRTWSRTAPLNDGRQVGAIQPTILTHPGGRLQALGRSRQGRLWEAWSDDGGKTWGPLTLAALPNPNAGIDAVTLADGRHLLVYNHTAKSRSPLNLAVSEDGRAWKAALVLADGPGEFSYPAVIQTADGLVHVTYTWKRERIRHAVVDPARLAPREFVDGNWPP